MGRGKVDWEMEKWSGEKEKFCGSSLVRFL